MDTKDKIIQGDALAELKKLPDESVDCIITSPPYWALRDYGVKGQLGLEPTYQEYINKLCDVFDEAKRVLRKDGTCWVNIGDTYGTQSGAMRDGKFGKKNTNNQQIVQPKSVHKCLLQIPSRFAIEMCNRGWILRNEIIWYKPNAMPSSARDRFTVDYEKVFFFVKNKSYWFAPQYEPLSEASAKDFNSRKQFRNKGSNNIYGCPGEGRDRREFYKPELGRNKRCVWKINTKPFSKAHFAVYPEALVEPMINAGCPIGGTVLDPFGGAMTTCVVAKKLKRNYIAIELNPEYIKIGKERLDSMPEPML